VFGIKDREEDLFGSSPFNSSNILCENPFKKPIADMRVEELSSPPQRFDLFPHRNSLGSANNVSARHDLFDSIPFSELAGGCVAAGPNLSQPTTPESIPAWPPVHRTPQRVATSSLSLDNETVSLSKPTTPSLAHSISAVPALAPAQAMATASPVAPGPLGGRAPGSASSLKGEKDGKYHLIEETRSPEKVNILPPKVSAKSKASSSTSHKKSKSKKSAVERDAGFSNLSFVDFPSDEAEEPPRDLNKFEVVRGRTRAGKWLP